VSVRAMAWAWEQDLPEGDKLLLMALADHADDEGFCWPGQESLGRKIGRSERTVRERLKRLETKGFLSRRPRYNGSGHRSSDMIQLHLAKTDYRQSLPAAEVTGGKLSSGEPPVVVSVGIGDNQGKKEASIQSGNSTGGPPSVAVDKLKVNEQEWKMATEIIAAFNKATGCKFSLIGTRGRPTEHLKRILGRVREHPEVDLAQHLEVVRKTCENPWWEGRPGSVGVIYGPAAFPRCLNADGRPTHGRKFVDERRTTSEEAPW
jgi:hypothetical protein